MRAPPAPAQSRALPSRTHHCFSAKTGEALSSFVGNMRAQKLRNAHNKKLQKRPDDAALFTCDLCPRESSRAPRLSRRSEPAHAQPPAQRSVILTSLSLSSSGACSEQKRLSRLLNSGPRFKLHALRGCEHGQLATGPLLLNHIYIECYVGPRRSIKIRQ